MDINRVILSGRLGSDPKVKAYDNNSVVYLRMASNLGRDNKKTIWVDLEVRRQNGSRFIDLVSRLKKGQAVLVMGRLTIRDTTYETNGKRTRRLSPVVIVSDLKPLDRFPSLNGSDEEDEFHDFDASDFEGMEV